MYTLPGFQTLPAHVLVRIALYTSKTESTLAPTLFDPSYSDDGSDKALLPLMGVNRTTRILVAPLFYKSATKIVGITDRSQYSHIMPINILSLDRVVNIGAQAHVKQLRITLDIYALEECLLEDSDNVQSVVIPSIEECGVLPAASTLCLSIFDNNYLRYEAEVRRQDSLGDPKAKQLAALDMPKELDAIKRAVLEVVPNVRRVIANKATPGEYGPSDHDKMRSREVFGFMENTVNGLSLGHISIINAPVSKQFLANLSGTGMALRSITLAKNKGSQQLYVELVGRNWMRLERLYLDHPTAQAVVKMTRHDDGSGTLVYPRLEYLCLNFCSGSRSASNLQPAKDPFPALTTLICRGKFPFSTSGVLTEGRKHIRRFDLDLDEEIVEAYGNDLFTDMSFRELESVSLGWWIEGRSRSPQSQMLVTRALNMGAKIRIARIQRLDADWLDEATFKDMHALSTLQALDMELTYITTSQAVTIFNACPRLQRALVSLQSEHTRNVDLKRTIESRLNTFAMYDTTSFQSLPAHILERIALCVPGTEPTFAMTMHDPEYCYTNPVKAYLPLIGINRTMRIIVAPLYYKFASMYIGNSDHITDFNGGATKYLNIDDVAKHGAQNHVKRLRLVLDINSLESAILDDASYVEDTIIPYIKACGVLSGVHSLCLFIYSNYRLRYILRDIHQFCETHPDSPKSIRRAELDMPKVLETIKQAVFKVVPRVRQVVIKRDNGDIFYQTEHEKKRNSEAVDFAESFVNGLALGHVALIRTTVSKKLLSNLSGAGMALRSITLSYNKGSQQHIELVRRNWMRLERLHIDHPTAHAVVKMTWLDGGSGTLVYPRLNYLCINVCSGHRNANHRHLSSDPFPVLTTLICRGQFPFATPVVLAEGRKHIRRLDIDIDDELMSEYGNDLFTAKSFQELQSVSLGWWARGPNSRSSQSHMLMTRTLTIGVNTQIAHIHRLETGWLDDTVFKDMHALSTLRILDMELTYITPNQALIIFNACPRLEKAYVSLRDEWSRRTTIKMPADSELAEFQEAHKSCTSRIRGLGIYSSQFSRSRRAAEYIVMLSNVLPCLKRVSLSSFVRVLPNKYIPDKVWAKKLFDAIHTTRKRKFYKDNSRVQSVDYSINNCW
ncbi:hypothetical protein EV175_000804 [Coemansia sp. RSA 1933]|nr:hypothetical protein EV175_000804 [Coemansia sp. RSA 1933]